MPTATAIAAAISAPASSCFRLQIHGAKSRTAMQPPPEKAAPASSFASEGLTLCRGGRVA